MPTFIEPQWPSLLAGYENAPALPDQQEPNGVYINPQSGQMSTAYQIFPEPLDNGDRGGFDVHVYYFQSSKDQSIYARELWERIRREFPELRVHELWTRPAGPHPVATFQVDILNPLQFGAFIPWVSVHRGPLSVLVHPNTDTTGMGPMQEAEEEFKNHTEKAMWMGERVPLDTGMFRRQALKASGGTV
ncbi:DOPA-like domain-containing protein [Xylariales sp. PMI_506]|nr:DOPA-like domain-containing protein [Xylariales sp. PMI_506]